MYVPEPPDPGFPSPLALQRVVRCRPAEIEKTRDLVRPGPVSADLSSLHRLIRKPWGSEFRVYLDDLTKVWCLHIGPKHRASLHYHPHKHTELLCLEGTGMTPYSGVEYALEPGAVMQIEPSAYRIAACSRTGLRLNEVQIPQDQPGPGQALTQKRARTDNNPTSTGSPASCTFASPQSISPSDNAGTQRQLSLPVRAAPRHTP